MVRSLRMRLPDYAEVYLHKKEFYDYFRRDSEIIIVEVGSYNGRDAIELKKSFPRSRVFTFEADPDNYKIVKQNCDKSDIRSYNLAVANKVGKQTFYPCAKKGSRHRSAGSLFKPTLVKVTHPRMRFGAPIEVNTTTLSKWAKEENIQTIHILWIDAQGAELSVLKGRGSIKIRLLYLEMFSRKLYENVPVYGEIDNYLKKEGFRQVKKYRYDALYMHA